MTNRMMKDSGIEWVGEIPQDWTVNKVRYFMRELSVKNQPNEMVLSLYRDYGVIPKDSRDDNHNVTSLNTSSYKLVEEGQLVINKMKAWQGSLAISEYRGIISPAYYIFDVSEKAFHEKFLHYLFRNPGYVDEYRRLSAGIRPGQWDLNKDEFKSVPYVYPESFQEQQKIAAFLDEKVAHIDKIIEDTKQSIENLKAYKLSLITETVTKGLNPDVEMKDSGIEWIGEIPNNWEISKVKYFFNIRLGKQLQPQKKNNEDSLKPYLRAANVSWSGIDTSDIKKMWFSKKETENYKLEYGDLIVSEGGDAGRAAIYKGELPECYVQNAVHRVRGENTYLLYYWLFAAKSVGFVDILCNKATFMHFTVDKFREFPYLRIPEGEQKEIINFLDNKSFEIDTTVYQKEQLITELESYKKSLIYEYVTGKKEVK